MYMEICFYISLGIFIAVWLWTLITSFLKYNGKRHTEKILFVGTFISGMIIFCAVNSHSFAEFSGTDKWIYTLLSSLRQAMGMFTIEGNYSDVSSMFESGVLASLDTALKNSYTGFTILLYAVSPILTFGFILSFIKNAAAHLRYTLAFFKEAHVFSELNERTLALAKSILKGDGSGVISKDLIVFTDVFKNDDEANAELIEEAKKIGAVLFSKDLMSIKYKSRFSMRRVNFYLISDNESEKTGHIEHIIENYDYEKTKLYVFSDSTETTLFLQSYSKNTKTGHSGQNLKIEVVRINDIRSLIYHTLDDYGIRLFENSISPKEKGGNRVISAVIFGLGKYGSEMLRALLWYCQIPGYTVHIKAYDEREDARESFIASCPGITLDEEFTSDFGVRYKIEVDTFKAGACDYTKTVADASYVFVCLGNDDRNLDAAIKIRCALEKLNTERTVDVETVIYDSNIKERISYNYENEPFGRDDMRYYKIHIIGDIDSFYSESTVINSKLIKAGFAVHSKWESTTGTFSKNKFFMNDYNFFSSLASALHDELRRKIYDKITGEGGENYCEKYFPRFTAEENGKICLRYLLEKTQHNEYGESFAKFVDTAARALRAKIAEVRYSRLSDEYKAVASRLTSEHYANNKHFDDVELAYTKAVSDGVLALDKALSAAKAGDEGNLQFLCDLHGILRSNSPRINMQKSDFNFESLSKEEQSEVDEFLRCIDIGTLPLSVELLEQIGDCAAKIEHIRWMAYMLASGFSYAKTTRNEFRLHSNLVSADKLLLLDKIKDI